MKLINVIDFCQVNLDRTFKPQHSELAMSAAKKMRRVRNKEKTGHVVCLHLLDMLAEEPKFDTDASSNVQNSSSWLNRTHNITQSMLSNRFMSGVSKKEYNDKQFSLAL